MSVPVHTQTLDGITYAWQSEWVKSLESEHNWRLYWRQQKIMEGFVRSADTVYEVGVGTGFTANYLRSKGVQVTTIDIDEEKNPDILANIVEFDWSRHSFDHLLAFETFEHIPFNKFCDTLRAIRGSCRGYVFISVPRAENLFFELSLTLPHFGKRTFRLARKKKSIHVRHFWELGYGDTSPSKFFNAIAEAGYAVDAELKYWPQTFFRLAPI